MKEACLICVLLTSSLVTALEPVTFGIGSGIGIAGMYAGFDYIKSYFSESCNDKWITANVTNLTLSLEEQLHGQHIVKEVVIKAVRIHMKRLNPVKPLVLSFHGWTGGGKNFVSRLIVESIFKEGAKSKFVHWFISTVHFPHESHSDKYKDDLQRWIKGNVSECQLSVFVFDEVDKMPVGVLDAVKPFLDYYPQIDKTDYRRCIFIFLSNTGGLVINQAMLEFWEQNRLREDIQFQDFQELIQQGAFNDDGGLHHTAMIEKSLIDYYVPFLPLERKHVKLCIRDELQMRGVTPTNEILDQIANEIPYDPVDLKLFSSVGCKRVAQKRIITQAAGENADGTLKLCVIIVTLSLFCGMTITASLKSLYMRQYGLVPQSATRPYLTMFWPGILSGVWQMWRSVV